MIKDLPLFPLNTVLFPNMPITLHIFEDRYKTMIDHCIAAKQPFGVVLIKKGAETGRSAAPMLIGCTAQIAQVQPLKEGRMNLVALGQDRFRIKAVNYDLPYLTGEVETLELVGGMDRKSRQIGQSLRHALTDYLKVLSNVGEVEFNVQKLPETPLELAYLSATLIQAPNEHKQRLLEINDGNLLLGEVYATCRREISVLRAMLAADQVPEQQAPFSLN